MKNTAPMSPSANTPDALSYDVEQFAELLARIYVRCLKEQDPQVMNRLVEASSTHQEVEHAAA